MVETNQFLQDDPCPECGGQIEWHERIGVIGSDSIQKQLKVRCTECSWMITRTSETEAPGEGDPPKGGSPQ